MCRGAVDQGSAAAQAIEAAAVGGCEQRVLRTRAQGTNGLKQRRGSGHGSHKRGSDCWGSTEGLRAADTQSPGSAGIGGSGQAQGRTQCRGMEGGSRQGRLKGNVIGME